VFTQLRGQALARSMNPARAMRRLIVLFVVLTGCASEMETFPAEYTCGYETANATILAPVDGSTVPRAVDVHVSWTGTLVSPGITMYDASGQSVFQIGEDDVQPDGSIIDHFGTLAANSAFSIDVAWFCISNDSADQYMEYGLTSSQFMTGPD